MAPPLAGAGSIRGTGVTDAGLNHLADLRSLTSLDVHGTRVTKFGEERLTKALPGLRIARSSLAEY